jgi:microsomal dipeptidase-like Zn-dependent dipeptidase
VLSAGGGAYMSATHKFGRVHMAPGVTEGLPPEVQPVGEADFRCYPLRGDSVAYYVRPLGVFLVKAMYREHVLVDLSHMRQDAVEETLALLDELDREHGRDPRDSPVIASHSGFRCGRQAYNLPADTVDRIARRDGVVGLIFAQHQLNDGIRRRKTRRLEDSIAVLCRHIDAIRSITGSHDHVAIGSDLDGFIKPTLGGLESAADLAALRAPLAGRYGEDADKILSANALRVLRKALAPR